MDPADREDAVSEDDISTRGTEDCEAQAPNVNRSACHMRAARVVEHKVFDRVVSVVIILNVAFLIAHTDYKAAHCSARSCPRTVGILVFHIIHGVFLLLYVLELLLRLYVARWAFFCSVLNLIDVVVVILGFWELATDYTDLPNLHLPQLFRLARLGRIIRLFKILPTLYVMVQGFAGAMTAMAWGLVLVIGLLLVWATIAVELVRPVNAEVKHSGDDEWCPYAFASVKHATLYFFQTIVGGDSWGTCSIPIIAKQNWTFLVFAGALVSVSLGIINLILATVVDKAARWREADKHDRIKQKRLDKIEFGSKLYSALQHADIDSNGTISVDELVSGYDRDPKIRETFDMLDVDQEDLRTLFQLMGPHGCGGISYHVFVDLFQKAQLQDMRVYLMVMKLQIQQIAMMLRRGAETTRPGSSERWETPGLALAAMRTTDSEVADGNWRLLTEHASKAATLAKEMRQQGPSLDPRLKALAQDVAEGAAVLERLSTGSGQNSSSGS